MIHFHCDILTPICINTGDRLDALSSFVDTETNTCHIIHDDWIEKVVDRGICSIDEIYTALKTRDNTTITKIKQQAFKNKVLHSINCFRITSNASNILTNEKSQGNIFVHATNHITGKPYIPGSTLKGILHSIQMVAGEDKNDLIAYIENHTSHADCVIQNPIIQIQKRTAKQGVGQRGGNHDGISTIHQTITSGSFERIITNNMTLHQSSFDSGKIVDYLKKYQNKIMEREKRILQTISKKSSKKSIIRGGRNIQPSKNQAIENRIASIEGQRTQRKNNYDVILKIGFHKKSTTFKNEWEKTLDGLYTQSHRMGPAGGAFLKNQMLKQGVGDRTMRVDEKEKPVGWIGLKMTS